MIDAFITFIEFCLEPWPSWARRWYGWLARVLLGVAGGMIGLLAIALGHFAAEFGNSPPLWDAQAVGIVWTGVSTIVVSLLAAIWPSKGTLALVGLNAAWLIVAGAVLD